MGLTQDGLRIPESSLSHVTLFLFWAAILFLSLQDFKHKILYLIVVLLKTISLKIVPNCGIDHLNPFIATHDIWLGHSKVAKFEVGVNGVSLVDPQWILSETLMGPLGLS